MCECVCVCVCVCGGGGGPNGTKAGLSRTKAVILQITVYGHIIEENKSCKKVLYGP